MHRAVLAFLVGSLACCFESSAFGQAVTLLGVDSSGTIHSIDTGAGTSQSIDSLPGLYGGMALQPCTGTIYLSGGWIDGGNL